MAVADDEASEVGDTTGTAPPSILRPLTPSTVTVVAGDGFKNINSDVSFVFALHSTLFQVRKTLATDWLASIILKEKIDVRLELFLNLGMAAQVIVPESPINEFNRSDENIIMCLID